MRDEDRPLRERVKKTRIQQDTEVELLSRSTEGENIAALLTHLCYEVSIIGECLQVLAEESGGRRPMPYRVKIEKVEEVERKTTVYSKLRAEVDDEQDAAKVRAALQLPPSEPDEHWDRDHENERNATRVTKGQCNEVAEALGLPPLYGDVPSVEVKERTTEVLAVEVDELDLPGVVKAVLGL